MSKSSRFYNSLHYPLTLTLLLWAILVVDYVLPFNFYILGILPRSVSGLWGIFTAPLVHGGLGHLLSNTAPFFFLSVLIFYFYERIAVPSIMMIWILTGVAVWLLGRPVYHIGASGVVYGLVAFVFWSGIFRRSIQSIILALIVVFLYSGMFIGILPDQPGISWESHLFGALTGILVAYYFRKQIVSSDDEIPPHNPEDDEDPPQYFLHDNTFGDRYRRSLWEGYDSDDDKPEERKRIW